MKMCSRCYRRLADSGGYVGNYEPVRQKECSIHPRMDNWRVERTLKTLAVWGLEPEGTRIAVGSPGSAVTRVVISLGDGWVHQRNAFLQLFDYERPFVELLIEEGMVERKECRRGIFDVDPTGIRVTTKGHVWLKERQLLEEARKNVEAKIAQERSLS